MLDRRKRVGPYHPGKCHLAWLAIPFRENLFASVCAVSRFAGVAGIATVIATVFAAWVVGGWGGEPTIRVVEALGLVGFAVFATACCVLAARSAGGRQRRAWTWMAVGLGAWTLGEVIWAVYILAAGTAPFPSVADAARLLYPLGACMALLLFPVGYTSPSRIRIALDGLLVVTALFEISWTLVLRDALPGGGRRESVRGGYLDRLSGQRPHCHHGGAAGADARTHRPTCHAGPAGSGQCAECLVGHRFHKPGHPTFS